MIAYYLMKVYHSKRAHVTVFNKLCLAEGGDETSETLRYIYIMPLT